MKLKKPNSGIKPLKKSRKISSRRWLDRQQKDPYTIKAKRQGWHSRSAFKLIEIDDSYKLFSPHKRVVDIGAAPGGWSQVAAKRCHSNTERPLINAIDILPLAVIPGVSFIQGDFSDPDVVWRLRQMLGAKADIVLCDIAPPTIGHHQTDHLRIIELAEHAAEFALKVLQPGGSFLVKILRGGGETELFQSLKNSFKTIKYVKPAASRRDSAEIYILAKGYHLEPR